MKYLFLLLVISMVLALSCTPRKERSAAALAKGISLLHEARLNEAKELFNKAVQYDPDNFRAWYYRGAVVFNINRNDTSPAISDLSKAIELNHKYADAWAARGEVYFFMGERTKACSDWKQAQMLGKSSLRDKTKFCP